MFMDETPIQPAQSYQKLCDTYISPFLQNIIWL